MPPSCRLDIKKLNFVNALQFLKNSMPMQLIAIGGREEFVSLANKYKLASYDRGFLIKSKVLEWFASDLSIWFFIAVYRDLIVFFVTSFYQIASFIILFCARACAYVWFCCVCCHLVDEIIIYIYIYNMAISAYRIQSYVTSFRTREWHGSPDRGIYRGSRGITAGTGGDLS